MGFNVNIRQILSALTYSWPILLFAGYVNYVKCENVLFYLAETQFHIKRITIKLFSFHSISGAKHMSTCLIYILKTLPWSSRTVQLTDGFVASESVRNEIETNGIVNLSRMK